MDRYQKRLEIDRKLQLISDDTERSKIAIVGFKLKLRLKKKQLE